MPNLSLADTLSFAHQTLTVWRRRHSWAELRIIVQDGNVVLIQEQVNHRDSLPTDRLAAASAPATVKQIQSNGNP